MSKTILDLNNADARKLLFRSNAYCNIDLPNYICFDKVLAKAEKFVKKQENYNIPHATKSTLKTNEHIHHTIFINKDNSYSWRKINLVNPLIYSKLVLILTEDENWAELTQRFKKLIKDSRIKPVGIPTASANVKKSSIKNWFNNFERESLYQSLKYNYFAKTDIADCYGSIYTHAICWALHGKDDCKKNVDCSLGNQIDNCIQDMKLRETNGIPVGSVVFDLIAELVLVYLDSEISQLVDQKLKANSIKTCNWKILRFRDDYNIFCNDSRSAHIILQSIAETLSTCGMHLNTSKTKTGSDPFSLFTKADKIANLSIKSDHLSTDMLCLEANRWAKSFPNSATLIKKMTHIDKCIRDSKKVSNNQAKFIASTVIDVMLDNPKVFPVGISILSQVFDRMTREEAQNLLSDMENRFTDIPKAGYMDIWKQRLFKPYDFKFTSSEPICAKVEDDNFQLWDFSWSTDSGIRSLSNISIIKNTDELDQLPKVLTPEEIDLFHNDNYPLS